jgi:YD repeat-containing protein
VRGASIARLKVLVPLAALLCGSQVMANDGSYKQVRGWSLYRNATNCSAFMMFDNGEAVGFTYDAPGRSTRVTFSDAEARSLDDGASPTFDILLRRPDGTVDNTWESTVFMVSVDEDGRRTLSSRWLGPPALESFMNASSVGFFDGDREIGVFSLSGTAAALQEVRQCSTGLRNGDS